jgi:hypothetical protein
VQGTHRATADENVLIKECIPHQQHSPNVYHINCTPLQQMNNDLAAANPPLPYAHILQGARWLQARLKTTSKCTPEENDDRRNVAPWEGACGRRSKCPGGGDAREQQHRTTHPPQMVLGTRCNFSNCELQRLNLWNGYLFALDPPRGLKYDRPVIEVVKTPDSRPRFST